MLSDFKQHIHQLEARLAKGHHLTPANVEEMGEHECLNCHTSFRGDFCPRCGQSAGTKRLTIRDGIQHLTAGILKFNKGMSHSIAELFYRPGYMASDYIHGYRKEYYPPVTLLLLLVAVVLFLGAFIPEENSSLIMLAVSLIDNLFSNDSFMQKPIDILNKILLTPSLRTLLVALISVPFIWIAFHRTKIGRMTNWAETFYLSVLISCNKLIWIILFFPFEFLSFKLSGSSIMGLLFGNAGTLSTTVYQHGANSNMSASGDVVDIIAFFLMIWIVRDFYKIKWRSATFRVILFYVLMTLLIILPVVIMSIISLFDPHSTMYFK